MPNKIKDGRVTWREDFTKHKVHYAMMVPYFFLFTLMVIVPIGTAMFFSFSDYNMFQAPKFIGISNFVNLLIDDNVFYIALRNTITFAIITGPISYVFCFFMAWLINEFNVRVRVLLTVIFYVPSLSSSVFFIWYFIFSGDAYGFLNGFLMNIGIIRNPVQWLADPLYMLTCLMIIQIWMSLGTGFLAFIAGFQSIDRSLYEAGAIDGVRNRFQELVYITLPMVKPQMIFSAIMQIAASFAVAQISLALCGFPSRDYGAHTLVIHIMDYSTVRYEMGYACAITVVLFALTLIFKKGIDLGFRYIKSDN